MNKIEKAFEKAKEYENQNYLFNIVYNLTKDKTISYKVKCIVMEVIRYIVLMDLYYETKDKVYKKGYIMQKRIILEGLNLKQKTFFNQLNNEIILPFWKYEEDLRRKIKINYRFTKKEILESIRRRSEDSVIYGRMAGLYCNLDEKIIRLLHIRQSIEDIYDCLIDYEEDYNKEPNIITLILLNKNIPLVNHPRTRKDMIKLIKKEKLDKEVLSISKGLTKKSNKILESVHSKILKKEINKILLELKYALK